MLLVAADASQGERIRESLAQSGYPVDQVGGPREAVARLKARPIPGLVIVDEARPRLHAPQLLREAATVLAAVPVIILAEAPYSHDYGPASSFLRKPVEAVQVVERALGLLPNPLPRASVSVVYQRGADGWWLGLCKELPQCTGRGGTVDLARRNLRAALRRVLGARSEDLELFEDIKLQRKGEDWRSF